MAISKITIPTKVPTSELEADEFNQIPETINALIDAVETPSHAYNEEHFIQDGVVNVGGDAYPQISINLNPDHFEIVNGMISIKANLLA